MSQSIENPARNSPSRSSIEGEAVVVVAADEATAKTTDRQHLPGTWKGGKGRDSSSDLI